MALHLLPRIQDVYRFSLTRTYRKSYNELLSDFRWHHVYLSFISDILQQFFIQVIFSLKIKDEI